MPSLKLSLIILSCYSFLSCKEYYRNQSRSEISDARIRSGESLATKYCQGCHLFPEPSQLDARSWEEGVLPNMGPRLGIFKFKFQRYPSLKSDPYLGKNFYPSKPILKPSEWQNIIDYYTATSPDSLPIPERKKSIKNELSLFMPQLSQLKYSSAAISFIKIDTSTPDHQLLLYDIGMEKIFRLNNQLTLIDSLQIHTPVVDAEFQKEGILICNIGVINPTNGKFGKIQRVFINSMGKMVEDTIPVYDKLARPVEIASVDLNQDDNTDHVICEFGHFTGSLSWLENLGDNKYNRHVLRAEPGAIKTYVQDYNSDGLPDLWVLFTQGEEGIFLFTNKGNGQFESRQVLRFSPVYGSTYFELADFNKDGYQDILYTCGDNADYSPVLKPYHGVYIFLNDGANHFKQKYFFPINGCFKALARDYDQDGDLDIAAIAFFADYARHPEEGFVYLENKSDFEFEAYSFPESKLGRWLTMDAEDLDKDGKLDIVLGNFSIRPPVIKPQFDWKNGPVFILLKNIGNYK